MRKKPLVMGTIPEKHFTFLPFLDIFLLSDKSIVSCSRCFLPSGGPESRHNKLAGFALFSIGI